MRSVAFFFHRCSSNRRMCVFSGVLRRRLRLPKPHPPFLPLRALLSVSLGGLLVSLARQILTWRRLTSVSSAHLAVAIFGLSNGWINSASTRRVYEPSYRYIRSYHTHLFVRTYTDTIESARPKSFASSNERRRFSSCSYSTTCIFLSPKEPGATSAIG